MRTCHHVNVKVLADELRIEITVCHVPAQHQQVEQDTASAVFLHHSELARQATD
jgi:hypothetical protein